MANNNKEGWGKKIARKAIAKALGYLFEYYPPEELLLMVKGQVNNMVNTIHQNGQRIADRYNQPLIETDEQDNDRVIMPAPDVKCQKYMQVIYTDKDPNGKVSVTIAGALMLEDGSIIPDKEGKTTFSNADELIDQQANRFLGEERDNLHVKLSHMLLPADQQEFEEDLEDEQVEQNLINEGRPPEAN